MAALVVITLLNVLTRYFTDQSFAWTEEISVFLMVADDAGRRQRRGGARPRTSASSSSTTAAGAAPAPRLRSSAACVTALLFAVLALLFARVVADEIRFERNLDGPGRAALVVHAALAAAVRVADRAALARGGLVGGAREARRRPR